MNNLSVQISDVRPMVVYLPPKYRRCESTSNEHLFYVCHMHKMQSL